MTGAARAAILADKLSALRSATLRLPFELLEPPFCVASPTIKQEIFDRYRHKELDDVVRFLDDCRYNTHLSGIRGDIFEPSLTM